MKYNFLFLVFLLIPIEIYASDGMKYGFAYNCNAERINNVLAEECIKTHPELSVDMKAALTAWKNRNQNRVKNCINEISKHESKEKREEIAYELEVLTEEIVRHVKTSAENESSSYCKKAISQLNDQKYDVLTYQ